MSSPLNRSAKSGATLGSRLEFFTIRTTVDVTPVAAAAGVTPDATQSQVNLDSVVEVINVFAQPVILNVETSTTETSPADLPGATGSVSVFTVKFAVEHVGAVDPVKLAAALVGVAGIAANTVAVTKFAGL